MPSALSGAAATPRRVVFNGRFLAQRHTGVQRYGLQTLCALDRLLGQRPALRQSTCWQLAVPHDAHDLPRLAHVEVHRLAPLGGHAWEQLTLRAHARGAYLVNTGYSGPVFKRKQCITVHDAAVHAQPQSYSRLYRWTHDLLLKALAPRVDTVMTVSRFAAQDIRRRYALERDDLLLARPGWEHAEQDSSGVDEAAVLQRHGLRSGAYLFAVGSLKPSKNFGLVPQALRRMAPRRARMTLAVAGECDRRLFADTDANTDSGGTVRWLGFVPDGELRVLYRHAAWFIFPSLYEGFGLPALEAMAAGCPVLAARSSSIPEVCGAAALYFDPHDPQSLANLLDRVSADDNTAAEWRSQLQESARARLAHYRWSVNAEILVQRLIAVGAVAAPAAASAAPAPTPLTPATR
jgi:glycosyltransferase involved in cell wall biosynthesis